jgi:hypothetical protein
MIETCLFSTPVQRLGLAYPVVKPADATHLLRLMAKPLLVALLVMVLGWSLLYAGQTTARMVTVMVAPAITAPIESRSLMSERDLQDQVDAYLANLTAGDASSTTP